MSHQIHRVALLGGTHGNELTGIFLLKKWSTQPHLITRPSFKTLPLLTNPEAFKVTKRFLDRDLNRCFTTSDLESESLSGYENARAKELAKLIGPQSQTPADFIIDMHTTTSNMGPTIILSSYSSLNLEVAAYLSQKIPALRVLATLSNSPGENPFINALAPHGFCLEVGPISQGTLDHRILEQTEQIALATLDFLEQKNLKTTDFSPPDSVAVYEYTETIDYPRDSNGELAATIHPDIQHHDFSKIKRNSPLFIKFDGSLIRYESDDEVYPVFVGEAAYLEKGIAMVFTKKVNCSLKL